MASRQFSCIQISTVRQRNGINIGAPVVGGTSLLNVRNKIVSVGAFLLLSLTLSLLHASLQHTSVAGSIDLGGGSFKLTCEGRGSYMSAYQHV